MHKLALHDFYRCRFVTVVALIAVALSIGAFAAPAAFADEANSSDSLSAAGVLETRPAKVAPSIKTQECARINVNENDIALYDLNGSYKGMLSGVYGGKKYIAIGGRYTCGNTRNAVSQAWYLLDDPSYNDYEFLVFDVDDDIDSFKDFASYESDRLHFFTGADYNSWAFGLYGFGSVTLPFLFAIDADGSVLLMGTGPHVLSDFIDEAFNGGGEGDDGDQPQDGELKVVSPNVTVRSPEQIIERMAKDDVSLGGRDSFTVEPVFNSTPGELSDKTKTLGLGMLNTIRYVAGLDDVTLDDAYGKKAQAAAFVDASIRTLTHRPDLSAIKPSGMSDDIWKLGCEGASSSNLSTGYASLSVALVYGWMSDADANNVDEVGHRRWCLNPSMKATGFGAADYFHAMYTADEAASGTQTNVVWPAQNMPYELFHAGDPWSISVGDAIRNPNKVTVTVTRKRDGRVWTFDKLTQGLPADESEACFYIDDGLDGVYAGQLGCIIFRPDGATYYAGDQYHVEAANVNGTTIVYDVKFFEGFEGYHSTSEVGYRGVIPGDVTCDGYVAMNDIMKVNSYLLKRTKLTDKEFFAADVTRDGVVAMNDILKINSYLLKRIDSL